MTYGQTELLLLFGKVSGEGHLKDFNDMKASEVSVKMMKEDAANKKDPLTQNFIRTLHHTAENGGYPPTQNGDIRSLFWLFSLMALQN